jgi:hypothetical protein
MDSAPDRFPLCLSSIPCINLTDPGADALLLFTTLCYAPTSENAVFHLGTPFMLGTAAARNQLK